MSGPERILSALIDYAEVAEQWAQARELGHLARLVAAGKRHLIGWVAH